MFIAICVLHYIYWYEVALQVCALLENGIMFVYYFLIDVSDLQNFVNVALATAAGGEDDFAHDRLSDLRTVGSGFGSLIYNLPKEAGYRELSQRCTSLWDSLKNNPLLSKKLV